MISDLFFLLFQKIKGARYIRAGKCKKCGLCCRMITFKTGDKFITEEAEFERLKNWQKHYNHFFISGKDENGILLFTCKSLSEDNTCRNYRMRSWFCRSYPHVKTDFIAAGGTTLEGCGFYFKSSKEFRKFLE
jgi:Fe-S-cluster containining protein